MAEEVVKRVSTDKALPDDVLMEILLRLPVRSLLSFRSVSKHWLSLIQNKNFIHLHITRPIVSRFYHEPLLILRTVESSRPRTKNPTLYSRNIVLTLVSDDETVAYKDDVSLDLLLPNSSGFDIGHGEVHLLGPCNGLFCITDTVDVVLFNPAIKQCRKLPCSPCGDAFESLGFGFDPVSNDFKVVRFDEVYKERFENSDEDDDDDNNDDDSDDDNNDDDDIDEISEDDLDFDGLFELCVYKVEIFSLSTNCWREVESVVPAEDMSIIYSFNLFINGAFHWLQGNNKRWILVFDLNTESFKRFELPDGYIDEGNIHFVTCYSRKIINLSVLREALAVIVHKIRNIHCRYLDVFDIWVMAEYGVCESWIKLYNFCPSLEIDRPLSFSKDGEFFLENSDGELVSFNLNTKAIKKFQVQGVPGPMHAFRYRQSLVSLK